MVHQPIMALPFSGNIHEWQYQMVVTPNGSEPKWNSPVVASPKGGITLWWHHPTVASNNGDIKQWWHKQWWHQTMVASQIGVNEPL
jgi:hypothetical protein